MRELLTRLARASALGAAALALAACGGRDEAADNAAVDAVDANAMLEAPGNDASALESVAETPEPATLPADNTAGATNGVAGETSGGDTGGNTLDNDVSGM